ncbi:alanine racemase [Metabacillus litoralis]|uniref:alanine racemase n=1 Tax=Metabacillus litoralis TaxID=152268 RepID=UPI001CFF3DAF|nr:alanine racemase [Metabacillus litoralis]
MQSGFYRDTWVEVNLDAIKQNVVSMKRHIGDEIDIIAVVKANGYGHGAEQVAKAAIDAGATMLAVAFLDEAISLRNAEINAPILVMGATRPSDVNVAIQYNVTLTVFSIDWLKDAERYITNEELHFHIKLDTGMGRLGVRDEAELKSMFVHANQSPHFVIDGIFTHFATADETDSGYFDEQYGKFETLLASVPHQKLVVHCANSATALKYQRKLYNAIRLGISMYGLTPSIEMKKKLPYELQEAFSLQSKLVHVKKITKGEKVSYGATYEAKDDEWIGTIPIGYADGWARHLKDFEVLVENKRVPLVGRICMDQCMVKLPHHLPIGTQVTLIGQQHDQIISIDDVANYLDTINYEVPCMITSRVPRIFLENMSIIEKVNPILKR